MENLIVNNLFEFYKLVGTSSQFLNCTQQYCYVKADNLSWPNIVFDLNEEQVNYQNLYNRIKANEISNKVFLLQNETIETQLLNHDFKLSSSIIGMYLDLDKATKPINDFSTIYKVNNDTTATEFARIASKAFNYKILPSTIKPLVDCQELKLFIGKHHDEYASCGMLLLDKRGVSGLHMIGTLPKYRGFGLGKIMTNKLLFEAYENASQQAVLGASIAGERVYTKLGFIKQGDFKSYVV